MLDVAQFAPRNLLLRALPPADFELLQPSLEFVPLKSRRVLHHARVPIDYLYFVECGLVSVLIQTGEDRSVEAWTIGRDGVTGIFLLVGRRAPLHRYVVQISGNAFRISVDRFTAVLRDVDSLRSLIFKYLWSAFLQTAQIGTCNLCHNLQQRLARWLLIASVRCGSSELPLTQSTLARTLGVRRASITETMRWFEDRHLLESERGLIRVINATDLAAVSCSCYPIIMKEQARLYPCKSAVLGCPDDVDF
jgi:CRP-like cAMP-binding protein